MKYAQKWMVVPFTTREEDEVDPCHQDNKLKKNLSHILHKQKNLYAKMDEYNDALAKNVRPMHPIIPASEESPQIKKLHFIDQNRVAKSIMKKQSIRKRLNYETSPRIEEEARNEVTFYETPSGHEPEAAESKRKSGEQAMLNENSIFVDPNNSQTRVTRSKLGKTKTTIAIRNKQKQKQKEKIDNKRDWVGLDE